MTHPPTVILRTLLLSAGQISVPVAGERKLWPCFIDNLPAEPDDAIVLIDTTPIKQGRIQPTGEVIQKYGIQIQLRAQRYAAGWSKIYSIQNVLDNVLREAIIVEGTAYLLQCVIRSSGVIPLGEEPGDGGKRRQIFTLNILLSFAL